MRIKKSKYLLQKLEIKEKNLEAKISKSSLTENAKKRLSILKKSNDGFEISEKDMKLRGYGDILGFKQSGLKIFKLADPVLNENLFRLAENEIKRIEKNNEDIGKFKTLMKLYDQADIINDIV